MAKKADLLNAVTNLESLMRHTGLLCDGEHLVLQSGSPTYGLCWRLFITGPDWSGGRSDPPFGSYLGTSKTEAYHSLTLLIRALAAVVAVKAEA